MASRHLENLLRLLALSERKSRPSVEEMRAGFEKLGRFFRFDPGSAIEPVVLGGVRGEWIEPPLESHEHAAGQIVFFHGGGYVTGSLATHRALGQGIARESRRPVLSVDYRLAPEHAFPAALEDAFALWRAVLEQGRAAEETVFVGDSAGGGLALALLIQLRDSGVALPAGAVCISPWTDLAATGASVLENQDLDPVVDRSGLLRMAELYLDGADPQTPLASPLYGDLRGLPPLLIQVGERELLLDDSLRLAQKCVEHDVVADLEVWPDMIHVWHQYVRLLPEAERAIERVGGWIRDRLAGY